MSSRLRRSGAGNRLFGLLLLSCLLLGCLSEWEKGTGHYQVFIDPVFDDAHHAMIQDSLDEWEANGHGLVTFHHTTDWHQENDLITIVPTTIQGLTTREGRNHSDSRDDWYAGLTTFFGTSNLVQISLDQSDLNFAKCSLHELGHAVGMLHTQEGTVMAFGLNNEPDNLTLTETDKAQFCEVWGC